MNPAEAWHKARQLAAQYGTSYIILKYDENTGGVTIQVVSWNDVKGEKEE